MVEGVQFRSFAQAAAATLKLLRSAQSRTLPAKNTITVTGQLIWRTSARGFALAAVSGLAGIAYLTTPSISHTKSDAAIRMFLEDTPHAPSFTGKMRAEGCS